jgi:serine protease inhibitor
MGNNLASIIGLTALVVCGCGVSGKTTVRMKGPQSFADAKPPTESQAKAGKQAADSVNEFAFRLAKAVEGSKPQTNLLVSPLSVSIAHSMLLAGATGDTQKEIWQALAYKSLLPPDVHDGMFALAYDATHTAGRELQTANALFLLQPVKVKPPFEKTLRDKYDADVKQLNGAGQESVAAINDWANEKTAGMIPKVFDQLDPEAVFVLANAATFIGRWKKPFDPSDTEDGDFTLAGGRKITVPMMSAQEVPVKYSDEKGLVALALDYESREYQFVVLMPTDGSDTSTLLGSLNATKWKAIVEGMREDEGNLTFPKFTFDASYDLIPVLKSLGVKKLFEQKAEFGGVLDKGPDAWVGRDVHLTHIEVDEEGTKAAAVTSEEMATAIPRPMKIDRPFLYAIVHQKTGVIVFLGICNDPTQNK